MKSIKLLVFLTVLISPYDIDGQTALVDSLIQEYENIPDTAFKSKMATLIQVIRYTSRSNSELHDNYLSEYDSLAHTTRDPYYRAKSIVLRGTKNYFNDDYIEATKNFLSAIEMFTEQDKPGEVGALYNNLAAISDRMGDKEKSLEYLKRGYEFYKLENNPNRIAISTTNLAYLLNSIGQIEEAKSFVDTSIVYYNKSGQSVEIGNAYRVKAQIARAENNYETAIKYEQEVLATTGTTYNNHKISALCNLIELYLETGELDKVREMINKVNNEIDINTFPRQKRGFEQSLELYYSRTGQYARAYKLSKSNQIIQDSIYSKEKSLAYDELLEKYESEKKEKEIVQLNAANESTRLKLLASKKTAWVFGISSLILLGLVYTLFRLKKDITKQKNMLSLTLNEKETLLKEIHHRVKNNLQVVSSLLFLQGRSTTDSTVAEALQEGQNRVRSMSLIHQKLYQEKHFTSVEVKEYFENLIPSIFDSYNISSDRIKLILNVSPMYLDVETLIPIGLITNELITNSLKHGFDYDDNGTIEVELLEKDNRLLLKVADSGKGMDEHNMGKLKNSFGYELLESFSHQLDADINISVNEGTVVEISIKDYKIAS